MAAPRRSKSTPNLAAASSWNNRAEDGCPYQLGNTMFLHIPDGRGHSSVRATIVDLFTPFTMACVMVIRVVAPALDLEGEFVLKAYDMRFAGSQWKRHCAWDGGRDVDYHRHLWAADGKVKAYFEDTLANEYLYYDPDGDPDPGTTMARSEAFIHAFCIKMHRNEAEVYRRAKEKGIDGSAIPRFVSQVRISDYNLDGETTPSHHHFIPGLLLQYLPGFSLTALYESPCPPPPQSTWQSIIDSATRAVQAVASLDVINMDVYPRNAIVHWDPIDECWTCKLIDFGNCWFRDGVSGDAKEEEDVEWYKAQAMEDEESMIGVEMEIEFERAGYGRRGEDGDLKVYRYVRSEWSEGLRVYMRED